MDWESYFSPVSIDTYFLNQSVLRDSWCVEIIWPRVMYTGYRYVLHILGADATKPQRRGKNITIFEIRRTLGVLKEA